MEPEDAVKILEEKLNKTRRLFDKYIATIESARRQYNDSTLWYYDGIEDELDDILQEFYNIS